MFYVTGARIDERSDVYLSTLMELFVASRKSRVNAPPYPKDSCQLLPVVVVVGEGVQWGYGLRSHRLTTSIGGLLGCGDPRGYAAGATTPKNKTHPMKC